jgi:thymidine kinase
MDPVFFGARRGWVEVVTGVMFSGKSEELIRRVRRSIIAKKSVQIFKSHLDDRYGGVFSISSHDGRIVEAIPVDSSLQISQNLRVILAGTETDFRGEPFGPMPQLMAVADLVDKLHAICVVCGGPASRNQRLIDGRPARYDSPTIMVGGRESYEARCRHCHELPRRDEDQVPLL